MLGAELIDPIAIPVRDLTQAESFYLELLGRRKTFRISVNTLLTNHAGAETDARFLPA